MTGEDLLPFYVERETALLSTLETLFADDSLPVATLNTVSVQPWRDVAAPPPPAASLSAPAGR